MTVVFAGVVDTSSGIEIDPNDDVIVGDIGTPDATLTGSGFVQLTTGNTIAGSTIDSVLINEDSSIEAVGGAVDGSGGGNTILVDVRNESFGRIAAVGDGAGNGMLTLAGNVINAGILSAEDGGRLVLDGIEIDNTNGVIAAFDATVLIQDSTVIGGTIATISGGVVEVADSVFDGTGLEFIQNLGNVEVDGGHSLTLVGRIANAAEIALETGATLVVGNDVADEALLGFSGTVFLSSSNIVEGASLDSNLVNIDNLIVATGGVVADGTGGNVIDVTTINAGLGVIVAVGDGAGHGLLTLAGKMTNFGTLGASEGAKLVVDGTFGNFGLVVADYATVEINVDIGEPAGALVAAGSGEILLAANAGGMVAFTGHEGAIRLADANAFSGVVAGAAGDLDLQDIPFNPAPAGVPPAPPDPDQHTEWTGVNTFELRYDVNATGTGGILSIVQEAAYDILDEGGIVVGSGVQQIDIWSTRLAGQYEVGDFTVGDNGLGGTLISGTAVSSSGWQTSVSGNWLASANWSDGVPDAWTHAELGGGTYTIKVSSDATVYSMEIGSQTTLHIANGSAFWTNEGTGEGGNEGTVAVAAGSSLNIAGVFQQDFYGVLRGAGTIGLHSAYVEGGNLVVLSGGMLESTVYNSTLQGVYTVNKGTVQATAGSTLSILGSGIVGGTIKADGSAGSASVAFGDSYFERGLLTTAAGGVLKTIAETNSEFVKMTIDSGTTLNVVSDSTLTLSQGWLQNGGVLAVGDTAGATLAISGHINLLGSGTIVLNDSDIVSATGIEPVRLINSSVIYGTGDVGDAGIRLTNNGVIGAFGGELSLDTGPNTISNYGVMVASQDASLVVESFLVNYVTIATSQVGTDGTVTLSDVRNYGSMTSQFDGVMSALAIDNHGTINVDLTSSMSETGKLTNRAGAEINNNGSYEVHSSVSNSGTIYSLAGSFTVDGDVVNQGTISIATDSVVTFSATLRNFDTIVMDGGTLHVADNSRNLGTITTSAASDVVHDGSLKNELTGVVSNFGSYEVNSAVSNMGTIETEGGRFEIDGNVSNSGSIESELGGLFFINGHVRNNLGGMLVIDDAFMFVESLTGGGTASITAGGRLEFGGRSDADVSFIGADNALALNESTAFGGDLTEFSTGDLLVFKDMLASDSINVIYTSNSGDTGGVLQVVDASTSITANINVVGSGYSTADFVASADAGYFALLSQHDLIM